LDQRLVGRRGGSLGHLRIMNRTVGVHLFFALAVTTDLALGEEITRRQNRSEGDAVAIGRRRKPIRAY